MRASTIIRPSKAIQAKRAGVAALAVLALTGGLASSEAQAQSLHGVGPDHRAKGAEIIGYDCTGRPITPFDTPPTWCPPESPISAEV